MTIWNEDDHPREATGRFASNLIALREFSSGGRRGVTMDKVGLNFVQSDTKGEFSTHGFNDDKFEKAAVEKVDIRSLTATQSEVSYDSVIHLINTPADAKALIHVVRKASTGKTYVVDGHHRLVAHMAKGNTTIRVKVLRVR